MRPARGRAPPGVRSAHGMWLFQVSTPRAGGSALDRVELRCAVADEDEQVLFLPELLVELRVAGVHAEDRRRDELPRRRDDENVPRPDPPEDLGAHLEVAATQDETLRANRA